MMSAAHTKPTRGRKRPLVKTAEVTRHASTPLASLPALPADVWGCISRAALAAEGSTMRSSVRLSLVCRTWRDGLRGETQQRCPSLRATPLICTHRLSALVCIALSICTRSLNSCVGMPYIAGCTSSRLLSVCARRCTASIPSQRGCGLRMSQCVPTGVCFTPTRWLGDGTSPTHDECYLTDVTWSPGSRPPAQISIIPC